MNLTKKAIKAVRENKSIRYRLSSTFLKSSGTINRWLDDAEKGEQDTMLTTAKAVDIIKEETGLSVKEIIA